MISDTLSKAYQDAADAEANYFSALLVETSGHEFDVLKKKSNDANEWLEFAIQCEKEDRKK